jgi:flagellar basal body-associated protein FliL
MKSQNQRKAFSMITAIVVIVLMATVAMLVMSMSGKLVKETTAQWSLKVKSYSPDFVKSTTKNSINFIKPS